MYHIGIRLCNNHAILPKYVIKYIGVNLFSLQLCVHVKGLTILCEKGTKFASRCWKLITEDYREKA